MANREEVLEIVIGALRYVEKLGGHEVRSMDENTVPIGDLAGFDSLSGVEVTLMVSEKLGVNLPGDVNAFVSPDGRRALRVGEIVDRITASAARR